jgi:hypothetical protein
MSDGQNTNQLPTLENWRVHGGVYGDVFGHNRFPDGTLVKTSTVVELDVAAGILKTRNSTYRLGKKG